MQGILCGQNEVRFDYVIILIYSVCSEGIVVVGKWYSKCKKTVFLVYFKE